MTWLFDTFVWTAALLALVLVTRRAVSRHLGPQAAYALWSLPVARRCGRAIGGRTRRTSPSSGTTRQRV